MLTRYRSTRYAFASVGEWLLQSKAFCLETSTRLCWEASYSRGARSSAPQPGWFYLCFTSSPRRAEGLLRSLRSRVLDGEGN